MDIVDIPSFVLHPFYDVIICQIVNLRKTVLDFVFKKDRPIWCSKVYIMHLDDPMFSLLALVRKITNRRQRSSGNMPDYGV